MRTPTAGRATLGVLGLLWLIFFFASAAWGFFWPEQLRAYSSSTWTDREIAICAACYVVVGSAGGIVAFRRLVMPLFQGQPRIGRNAAPCLASVGIVPSYPDFEAVHRRAKTRALAWSIGGWIFAMTVVYGVFGVRPFLAHAQSNDAFLANTVGWIVACGVGVGIRLLRSRSAESIWWSSPQLCTPCRVDFFDDGIHVYGYNFGLGLPWDQIRRAERVGEALALQIPKSYVIIPPGSQVDPDANAVIDLLRRKRNLRA